MAPIQTFRNNSAIKDNLVVALSLYPIKRQGEVQSKINADKPGEMGVSVFNRAGQVVLKAKMAAFMDNSGHINVCRLERCINNIKFNLNGKSEIKRVVVR